MRFDLDEEQSDIRNMVRRFTAQEITPYAETWDETHHFPREVYHKMAGLGLMGMTTPEEYGGRGPRPPPPRPGFFETAETQRGPPGWLSLTKKIKRSIAALWGPA